ncbi:MAG: hypothetical protein V4510_06690 [bacterium]
MRLLLAAAVVCLASPCAAQIGWRDGDPFAGPIEAVLTPPYTDYHVNAWPDDVTYTWANSNTCGTFEQRGATARWTHGDETDCHRRGPGIHAGTITVTVHSSDGNHDITRSYAKGSVTGTGPEVYVDANGATRTATVFRGAADILPTRLDVEAPGGRALRIDLEAGNFGDAAGSHDIPVKATKAGASYQAGKETFTLDPTEVRTQAFDWTAPVGGTWTITAESLSVTINLDLGETRNATRPLPADPDWQGSYWDSAEPGAAAKPSPMPLGLTAIVLSGLAAARNARRNRP